MISKQHKMAAHQLYKTGDESNKVATVFFFSRTGRPLTGPQSSPLLLTQHPGQYHPLHSGWCRSLPVLLSRDNVLRSEEQQEQKGQVGRRVADELDEGLADEEAVATLWSDEVAESKRRVEEADEDAGEELPSPLAASPAGELVIPAGCQKLLAVWLSYKLEKK